MRRLAVIVFPMFTLVGLLAGPGWAGLDEWSGNGPTGGPIRALLVDAATPSTIYAGTLGRGVFKSIDGGMNWVESGLPGRTVRALVQGNPGVLYAGVEAAVNAPSGGVFESTDGGATWNPLDVGLTNKKVMALAFDGTTTTLYAGTREEGSVTGGVFKWDGLSWTQLDITTLTNRRVQALAVDPRSTPVVIYAGTQGQGVFKSADGGASWTQISNQGITTSCLLNPEVLALAVDINRPAETLYAGITGDIGTQGCGGTPPGRGAGFFRWVPSEWDRRMNGMEEVLIPVRSTNVWAIVMNTSVNPTRIYIGTDVGVWTSSDSAGSWDRLPKPSEPDGLESQPIRALGIDPTSSDLSGSVTLYAGTSGRGVFTRFPNVPQGEHPWTAANSGLTALRAQSVAIGEHGGVLAIFAGLVSGGIISSVDNGTTWQDTTETARTVRGIAVDPANPNRVYAATDKGVLKTDTGGDAWAQASAGLPTAPSQDPNDPNPPRTVRAIVAHPAVRDVLYAAVGGVHRSLDGGASWSPLNGNLPGAVTAGDGTVSAFAIDLGPGGHPVWGTLFAATDGSGVFRSTNGGASWELIDGILPGDGNVTALARDPFPVPTLYAGTASGNVYRTAGTNWLLVGSPSPGKPITALVIALLDPRVIFAALGGEGVYFSEDNGETWTSMNAGLPSSINVAGLAFDGTAPLGRTLYAATLGGGMFDFQFASASDPDILIGVVPPSTPTSPLQVNGLALDDTGISKVLWSTNRGHAGPAVGTDSWTASVTLEPGLNIVTLTAVDTEVPSNEGSASFHVEFTPPSTPPTVTITTPTSAPSFATATTPLAIGGTAQDDSFVVAVTWVNSLGGGGTASETTSWTASVPLQPGLNVITVTAEDELGNTGTDTITASFSPASPTVTITTPTSAESFATTTTPLAIGGTAGDDSVVVAVTWVNSLGGGGIASETTSWTASVPLQPGLNVITVTAEDELGNTGTDTIAVSFSTVSVILFADVPASHIFFNFIQALATAGITGGCSINPPLYCPDAAVSRDQMAVFLLRGIHIGDVGYQPPAATGTKFTDVPVTHAFARWIEQLFVEGITGGCSTSPLKYCPDAAVTRGQMAVFLLRAKHGPGYQPPAATGMFTDVPVTHPFARWIEQLFVEGITGGCSTSPLKYCPDAAVTRGQMAVFLVRTFNLPM